ncbi:hypothetical protein AB0A73_21390 [Glycomyces sp. NPDC047369]
MLRTTAAALSLLFAVALAGCSGGGELGGNADQSASDAPDGTGAAEEPSAAADAGLVVWADAFCAAPDAIPDGLDLPFQAAARNDPATEDDRPQLVNGLAAVRDGLDAALEAIDVLPAAPTPEAEEAVEAYRADMEADRVTFADYLELAPIYPVEQLEDLYFLAGIDTINLPYPLMMADTYLSDPALAEAAADAASC